MLLKTTLLLLFKNPVYILFKTHWWRNRSYARLGNMLKSHHQASIVGHFLRPSFSSWCFHVGILVIISFSSVLPTSQMVYCAGEPIERVVYRFYEITMEKICQWEKIYYTFLIKWLVVIKIMKWRDKTITPRRARNPQEIRRKSVEQSNENISR